MAKAKKTKQHDGGLNVLNREYEPECPLSKLKLHPENARQGDIGAIHASFDTNGFYGAVIAQVSTGNILVGNHRYIAATQKGVESIPVMWVDVDDATALRILVSDNRHSDLASYDNAALAEVLERIKLDDTDLGFTGTGWDEEAYQNLLSDLSADALGGEDKQGLTDDDEVPETPEEPVSKLGDLWILGKHRLICGDSTKREDVERLMDGQKADLVVTDPPYNVAYKGKTKDALTIQNDSMSDAGFYSFLFDVYSNIYESMKDGAAIYVFHADTEGVNFRKAMVNSGLKLSQCCVWVKQTLVMGRQDYHWQHEPVLYGWKPTASHSWYSDRKQTTVWNFDRPTRSTDPPTMKPVELIQYPISNSSKANQAVLDLFGGSGSTLIACEKTNRQARLMELDPKYCDVIVKRWQDFTGESATLDGRTFDEVAMERAGKAVAA